MQPRAWVKSVTFSDGTTIALEKNDVVVIVGPNNSGKSAALRGIRDKFPGHPQPQPINVVVSNLDVGREGSADDLVRWLETTRRTYVESGGSHVFYALGSRIDADRARSIWPSFQLQELAHFFCHLLTAEERLTVANRAPNVALTTEPASHPIHYLQRDDRLEQRVSNQFRRAFGLDLVLHRNAGSAVPVHVGEKPTLKEGQDRVSFEYVVELEKLPTIEAQGDGMRSFLGVLLYAAAARETLLLIDEPEAFLHPPQARHLGQILVQGSGSSRQLFVATHSGDVLRGMLDSDSPSVRVIRLRRVGDVNVARELSAAEIANVWNDPLLRYSNILDGLFHEKVIVCEGDADCRFYAAIADVLYEAKRVESRKPDIMFTHCGGTHRLALVVRALGKLEVPIVVVADFDLLRDEYPLRDIVDAAKGDWNTIEKDWNEVRNAISGRKPELSADEVKKEVRVILETTDGPAFPLSATKKIGAILRRSSPWSTAKSVGTAYVPSGQPSQACERVLSMLRTWGIFVVPSGELESFCKTASGHGPSWVNEVLRRDLRSDPELQPARNFVVSFLSDKSESPQNQVSTSAV